MMGISARLAPKTMKHETCSCSRARGYIVKVLAGFVVMEDKELHRELKELRVRHSELIGLYVNTKQAVLDSTWAIVELAKGLFVEIKPMDRGLVETEGRVGEYSIQGVLGKGQYSIVKGVSKGITQNNSGVPRRKRRDGDGVPPMAVKIVNKEDIITIQSILAMENEIRILKEVGPHKNVVNFVELLHGPRHLYIIMERVKRDLFSFMEDKKDKMDTNIIGLITKEILSGVAHLTQHRVVHRDIKPENVLIDVTTIDIVVKLCDFGHSRQLQKRDTTLTNDFAGSPGFYAPETVITKTYDAFKADVYSVACVTLEMLVSTEFFSNEWMVPFQAIKGAPGDLGVDEKHDFYLEMRRTMLAAHHEVEELYGAPGEGVISEFVCSVIHMQPELRPSVMTLLNTVWLSHLDKASACDRLLDREHLYVQYRRFSYLPPGLGTKGLGGIDKSVPITTQLPLLARGVKVPDRLGQSSEPPSRKGSTTTLPAFDKGESRRRSSAHVRDNGLGMMTVNPAELAKQAAERRQSFLTCNVESKSFRGAVAAAYQAKKDLASATDHAEALAQSVLAELPMKDDRGGGADTEEEAAFQHVPFGGGGECVADPDGLQFFMEGEVSTDKEDVSPPVSRAVSRKHSFC